MRKLFFFLKRALVDIKQPFRFNVSREYLNNPKMPYGLDYSSEGMHKYYRLREDDNGIIMMSHYIDHQSEESNYYSPVKIAHYALGAYNDYLKEQNPVYLERFSKHVSFLVENHKEIEINGTICIVWTTPSTNPKYNIGLNYISAIVQGLVISSLCRAYIHYNDEIYKELSEKALNIFTVPVEHGGILAHTKWGDFYEEYPCVPYSHVVNGFAFALIGLFDCWHICNSNQAKTLYDKGLGTLIDLFPDWYTKNWSKYDLRDITNGQNINLATQHYQCLHADLLKVLFLQSNRRVLNDFVEITESQLRKKSYLLMVYLNKFYNLILKE